MAASCTRLSFAVGRLSWRRLSYYQSSIRRLSSHSLQPSVCSSLIIPSHQARLFSNGVNTPLEEYKDNRSFIQKFLDWIKTKEDDDNYVMSEEERKKRDDLLRRVQEMYFAKPPITPDLPFYKEVFETLMAYNDSLGVDTIWRLMIELGVEPDEELVSKVKPFLEKARRNSLL